VTDARDDFERDDFERDDFDAPGAPVDGDAIDHLWNAAHEMLGALRTLIDAADEFVESQRSERPAARGADGARAGRVHHIDIDLGSERSAPRDAAADFGAGAGAS
jgi:hypothetical protein